MCVYAHTSHVNCIQVLHKLISTCFYANRSSVDYFFSILISLSHTCGVSGVAISLWLFLVRFFLLLLAHIILLVHPYSLLHGEFLHHGREEGQK